MDFNIIRDYLPLYIKAFMLTIKIGWIGIALSLLANCHNRNDVEDKISIFRQFIASDLPPLWQQFFHSLLQHCNPLQKDKQTYQHYTLQPDNSDLIHLITTDPVLRQIVVRAEGYRILVKSDDLRKFEAQLKKHGYLL